MDQSKILPIILEPNPLLHTKSEEVKKVDSKIIDFSNSLVNTMKHHKGLGIAAVQVGVLKRIIAIDMDSIGKEQYEKLKLPKNPVVLINPQIIETSKKKQSYVEGCLSFGNIFPRIERFNKVKVQYLDLNEQQQFLEISDTIVSSCLQHEIDHINGVVFLDRLSRMKKDFMMKKYLKWRKKYQ